MLISYSVQAYGSWFFYNQEDEVTFLCSYKFWFYNQGDEDATSLLTILDSIKSRGRGDYSRSCLKILGVIRNNSWISKQQVARFTSPN